MANSLKTMWSALAVSLAAISSVNAAFFDDNCCPPADCPCPSSRPFLDPCGNWYLDVEGLCWEASEDGLAYATKYSRNNPGQSGSPTSGSASSSSSCGSNDCDYKIDGRVKNIGSHWDGGFKVGIGTDLPCDGWDTLFKWTWFRTKKHQHEDNKDDSWLVGAYNTDCDDDYRLQEIKAKWHLNLNIFDWEIGREFCVSPCLSLRPFIGIRAAWVDQKYDIHSSFAGNPFDADACDNTRKDGLRMKSKFSGAGVRGGLNSEWKWGCGFSIYGDFAGSILWGKFRRNTHLNRQYTEEVAGEDYAREYCLQQKDHTSAGCRAITDAAIGLRWKQFFDCDRIALTFSIGWEHHCFFDQNRFENFGTCANPQPQVERGDLYTQGVTFAARLDF